MLSVSLYDQIDKVPKNVFKSFNNPKYEQMKYNCTSRKNRVRAHLSFDEYLILFEIWKKVFGSLHQSFSK